MCMSACAYLLVFQLNIIGAINPTDIVVTHRVYTPILLPVPVHAFFVIAQWGHRFHLSSFERFFPTRSFESSGDVRSQMDTSREAYRGYHVGYNLKAKIAITYDQIILTCPHGKLCPKTHACMRSYYQAFLLTLLGPQFSFGDKLLEV